MSDSRTETIDVNALSLGMFVTELDRPWLETPFMLQGFLLEEEEQIETLKSLCKTVVIDRVLSINEHKIEIKPEKKQFNREDIILKVRYQVEAPIKKAERKKEKKSTSTKSTFFEILRELKEYREVENHVSSSITYVETPDKKEKKGFLLASKDSKSNKIEQNDAYHTKSTINNSFADTPIFPSLTQEIIGDISNVVNSVKNVFKLVRFKPKKKSVPFVEERQEEEQQEESARIYVYEEIVPVEEEIAEIYPVYDETKLATREVFESLANEKNIDLKGLSISLDSMVDSIERNPDALMWLAKLKQSDDYAYNQALNVSINMMAFAQFMALPREQVKELGLVGLMQDVGKIKLDANLLQKADKLTPEEYELMKSHVSIGLEMLQDTPDISDAVRDIIAKHHERVNGSGYPHGLKEYEISLPAQMAGMIDTYCAITSNRIYAKGLFNQNALEEMYEMRDKEFSAALVDQLIQFLGIYPISSLVELNTGEVAVVIQQNQVRRLQPRLMILLAPDKSRNKYPPTIDLIHNPISPNGEPYKIVKGIPPDSYGLSPSDFFLD